MVKNKKDEATVPLTRHNNRESSVFSPILAARVADK